MAADSKHGAPRWLAFICGALAVTLGLIGYQAYVGHNHARSGDRSLTVRLQAPDLPTPPPFPAGRPPTIPAPEAIPSPK